MAKPEPIIPTPIADRLKALVSGGASQPGLERERSDPDGNRGPSPPKEEQGSHPNDRGDGGSGDSQGKSQGNKGDRELSVPPAISKQDDPFVSGNFVLKAIMDRFVELRESGKVGAWRQLQTDLMKAAPFLIPHIITLDKVIDIAATIEKEIKGSTMSVGKSNEELLSEFLNGGGTITIDNHATLEERVEESTAISTATETA